MQQEEPPVSDEKKGAVGHADVKKTLPIFASLQPHFDLLEFASNMFNSVTAPFLDTYIDSYPECRHCRNEILRKMKMHMQSSTYFKMFMASCKGHETLIANRRAAFFNEPSNVWAKHMELWRVWDKMDADAKEHVWDYFQIGSIICTVYDHLPENIINIVFSNVADIKDFSMCGDRIQRLAKDCLDAYERKTGKEFKIELKSLGAKLPMMLRFASICCSDSVNSLRMLIPLIPSMVSKLDGQTIEKTHIIQVADDITAMVSGKDGKGIQFMKSVGINRLDDLLNKDKILHVSNAAIELIKTRGGYDTNTIRLLRSTFTTILQRQTDGTDRKMQIDDPDTDQEDDPASEYSLQPTYSCGTEESCVTTPIPTRSDSEEDEEEEDEEDD